MHILADENVAGDVVSALRADQHDVVWACTALPGAKDEILLELAVREKRLLLTNDVGFAALAAREERIVSSGIMLMRFRRMSSAAIARQVAVVVRSRDDWAGHFTILGRGGVRIRQL
jgi:predicted nuclease of predicted toxin-antitoxin system